MRQEREERKKRQERQSKPRGKGGFRLPRSLYAARFKLYCFASCRKKSIYDVQYMVKDKSEGFTSNASATPFAVIFVVLVSHCFR